MRTVTFKMERPGLVKEGQTVELTELPGINYNYIIEPAVAMSGCFKLYNRIKSKTGVIKKIIENERGYYIELELDEPDPDAE